MCVGQVCVLVLCGFVKTAPSDQNELRNTVMPTKCTYYYNYTKLHENLCDFLSIIYLYIAKQLVKIRVVLVLKTWRELNDVHCKNNYY